MDVTPQNLIRALVAAARIASPGSSITSLYWTAECAISGMGFEPDDTNYILDELSREKSRALAMERSR